MKRSGLSLQDTIGSLVLPGDEFLFPSGGSGDKVIIGPGLKLIQGKVGLDNELSADRILACKAGTLAKIKNNTYLVELKTKSVSS
jgi:hypothetical protein